MRRSTVDRTDPAPSAHGLRPGRTTAFLHPASWPWWAQALGVYALTRVWSTVALLIARAGQPDSYWGPGPPSYADFVGLFWDASWYRDIATGGYPATLPVDANGVVQQNAWAFYPLFPLLIRALMAVTGLPWQVLAPTAALLLGAGAAVVIDRLVFTQVRARGVERARYLSLGTVLLVGLFPSAPVLQVAYTESLSLLLVALVLWLVVRRSYGLAALAVLALGFTRAVALPMAVVIGVHLLARTSAHRRGAEEFPRGDVIRVIGLGAIAVVAGFAWPVICGVVTGVPDAYLRTQGAWRGSFSGASFVPWLEMARYLLGSSGVVVLVLLVSGTFALGLSRPARAAGPEVQAWGLAYPAWLLAVAFPQTSTFRFLLLAFPLGMATVGILRSRWALAAVAVAFAIGQVVWVIWLWQLTTATAWPP